MTKLMIAAAALAILVGCAVPDTATDEGYAPPEASGLVGVRPYPTPLDVCEVIGESDETIEYLDDSALLIGCPASETGAIADREAEGAVRLETVGDWVLFSVPLR